MAITIPLEQFGPRHARRPSYELVVERTRDIWMDAGGIERHSFSIRSYARRVAEAYDEMDAWAAEMRSRGFGAQSGTILDREGNPIPRPRMRSKRP